MKNKIQIISEQILRIVRSKWFFVFIVSLAVVQGLWFAVTYQPGLFDEKQHFDFANAYSQRLSPFMSEQSPQWDSLGEVTRAPSYLFYYLLSLPLRIVQYFTDSYFIQVFTLRIIFLGIFIVALFKYRHLLYRLSGSKSVAHLVLATIVTMPVFATLPSVINYDIVIFLLFPIIMLLLLDLMDAPKLSSQKLGMVIILSLFASLIKFSFMPIFAALTVWLVAYIYIKKRKQFLTEITITIKTMSRNWKIAIILGLIVFGGLFVERHIANFVIYRETTPSCTKFISEDRCMKNYTVARNITFEANKPQSFNPLNPIEYFFEYWALGIMRTEVRVLPTAQILPVIKIIFYALTLTGGILFLIYVRDFLKSDEQRMLIVVSLAYVVALFVENYMAYVRLGQPVAISARYLLPVLPIFMTFTLLAVKRSWIFRNFQVGFTFLSVIVFALILTQGGSLVTHLFTVPEYYWDNNVREFNEEAKEKLQPIVKE